MTVSVLDAGARRFRCQTDNQGLFPHVCAKAGNGFIPRENCFVARARTKQFSEKFNDIGHIQRMEPGFGGIPQTIDRARLNRGFARTWAPLSDKSATDQLPFTE